MTLTECILANVGRLTLVSFERALPGIVQTAEEYVLGGLLSVVRICWAVRVLAEDAFVDG